MGIRCMLGIHKWVEDASSISRLVSVTVERLYVCELCGNIKFQRESWHSFGVDVTKRIFNSKNEFWSWYKEQRKET